MARLSRTPTTNQNLVAAIYLRVSTDEQATTHGGRWVPVERAGGAGERRGLSGGAARGE